MFILVIFDKFILIGKLQQITYKRTIEISKLGRRIYCLLKKVVMSVHVLQKHCLHMKVRLITSFGRDVFGKTGILSCDCCTWKQYLDKVEDLNFAKSFFQKIMNNENFSCDA